MQNINEQIENFKGFIEQYYEKKLHELDSKGVHSVYIDFFEIAEYSPELAEFILENPEDAVKSFELAISEFEINLKPRIFNLPKSQFLNIRDIRSQHLGKFIYIEGIVRQASDVRPQVTSAKFECPTCGNTLSILQLDTKFKEPSRCSCGNKTRFRLLSKDLIDAQRLVIEESPENLEGGEQSKRLPVYLKEDLVEPKMEKKTTPGSKVRVNGIIKEISILLSAGAKSINYDLSMDANSIIPIEETFEEIEISKEDEEKIKELSRDPLVYEKLIGSIAPSIYGHEKIKEAIILQLMSGVRKVKDDGTIIRGDMHILLVGDPGAAKSSLLQFVSKSAPKARFVSGKGSSGAGLTASVIKDEFIRGWALEAGALVLANGGLAAIDELDKMSPEDRSAIHEALEQQQVSIAKANIQACYSSDTEVLTNYGWKKYWEIKDEKLAQYNLTQKIIEFLQHDGLFVYNYVGKMYHFKNKRIDIFVTPNHKMLTKELRQKEYRAIEAEKIRYNRIKFLNSGNFLGKEERYFILPPIKHKQNRIHIKYVHQHKPKKIPMNLWLEFLGYYLTEGGIQRKPTIGIPQKDKKNIIKIKKCLFKLSKYVGFTLSETKDKQYIRFQITNTQLFEFLEKNCGKKCIEKKYPLDLSNLSKKQLKILYDAMMLGDGSSDGKSFSSTSIELINLFQSIALLIGKSTSKNIQYLEKSRRNRVTLYRVTLSNKTEPSIKKNKIKNIYYDGKVFCFSTKTGFFVTRRNGKVTIQGNTLRAQTSVLAAANPKLGRFDPYSPIASQIDLPPTLINRFDLIFPVRDIPNREKDEKIASHVLELQKRSGKIESEISTKLLRKYIAYEKQHVKPILTDGAVDEIKKFYVNLRNKGQSSEEEIKPIPISARQLEALVRLSEASAKVRLSKEVKRKDAKRAIDILTYCLMQVGIDPETGKIDIDRISTGITATQRSRIVVIREIIRELESKHGKSIPMEAIFEEASKKGYNEDHVEEAIEKLKREAEVYNPKQNFVSRL